MGMLYDERGFDEQLAKRRHTLYMAGKCPGHRSTWVRQQAIR